VGREDGGGSVSYNMREIEDAVRRSRSAEEAIYNLKELQYYQEYIREAKRYAYPPMMLSPMPTGTGAVPVSKQYNPKPLYNSKLLLTRSL